jgi:hypothetical protein
MNARHTLSAALLAALVIACDAAAGPSSAPSSAPPSVAPASVPPSSPPSPGTGLVEVPDGGLAMPVPSGWTVVEAGQLADEAALGALEAEIPGLSGLLAVAEASGDAVRPIFFAVDQAALDAGTFPANVAMVAIEPQVPDFLLGVAADIVAESLEDALALEGDVERSEADVPAGDAERLAFEHSLTVAGQPVVASGTAYLLTTPSATVLVVSTDGPGGSGSLSLDDLMAGSVPLER